MFNAENKDARRSSPFADLRADLFYALRVLRRSPAFAAVAIVSLALGIGANALVFSVVNSLVLRPLPIADPARVFSIQSRGGMAGQSYPNYVDLRDRNDSLEGLVGYRIAPLSVEGPAGTVRSWGYLATGNYFDVLGVNPVIGRFFHAEDDRRPGASPLVVLSYDEWQSRFAGSPSAIGSTIRINRLPYTIIGVAPRGFRGTELFYQPAMWVPMMMEPQIEVGNPWLDRRQTFNVWTMGRLKPGVTPAQATANLNAVASALAREYPLVNQGMSLKLAQPGLVGDLLRGPVRAFTLGVLGLASLVLLAACANLASLLTARASDRRREMAIRISIGAGRGRLVRQLLTEAVVLALIGGACGAVVAIVAARALSAWHAPVDFPVQLDVTVDVRVLLFAIGVSAVAGVLFGVAPARQASRTDASAALKGGNGVRLGLRRVAFRDLLVTIQVALCFVLVTACLLSLRGLQRALNMSLGLDPRGVVVAGFDVGLAGYTPASGDAFQRRVLNDVRQLPGVITAAYSNSVPLSIDQSTTVIYPEGQPLRQGSDRYSATYYQISQEFFAALGVRRITGRDFDSRDTRTSAPVAIVNETFAHRFLQTSDAVGHPFRYGPQAPLVEVVGMVEDGRYQSLTEDRRPVVFMPIAQNYNATTTLIVRSSRAPEELVGEVRRTIARLDPGLPVYGAGSLRQMLAFALFPSRAAAIALSAFGLLALTLAATGLHGLVSYAVARRSREIGIRMAVGATSWEVLRVVLTRTAIMLGIGGALGLALALISGEVLASVVYGVSPRDPVAFVAVGLAMITVGIASCWSPALRALRIDPVSALRAE
jgi:predicted permease